MERPRILVVDDDEEARGALREILEMAGCEVLLASNGKDALDVVIATRPPPDLIVLDLVMPVMGGWEFMAVLRSYSRLARIPVLVVSGHAVSPKSRSGMTGFLAKPISPPQLLRAVRSIVPSAAGEPA